MLPVNLRANSLLIFSILILTPFGAAGAQSQTSGAPAASPGKSAITFHNLGIVGTSPAVTDCFAYGLSSDGNVVVGTSDNKAFYWSKQSGMKVIPNLPGYNSSTAYGANADGSIITGYSHQQFIGTKAFRWTKAGGTVAIAMPAGFDDNYAFGVSGNGAVIVGGAIALAAEQYKAFRWSSAGQTNLTPAAMGSGPQSIGVNYDGSVIIGTTDTNSGNVIVGYRWTADGLAFLPMLDGSQCDDPHTFCRIEANGVSADGATTVGATMVGETAPPHHAVLWTALAAKPIDLGSVPNCVTCGGDAIAVNAHDNVVVGNSPGDGAFRWTSADKMKSITAMLQASHVKFDVTPFYATAVSADGGTIAGYGIGKYSNNRCWIAHVPVPAQMLQVSPARSVSTQSPSGGPATPAVLHYAINSTGGDVRYSTAITFAPGSPHWLSVAAPGVAKTSAHAVNFVVSAAAVPDGTYTAIIAFKATGGHGITTRTATLHVGAE